MRGTRPFSMWDMSLDTRFCRNDMSVFRWQPLDRPVKSTHTLKASLGALTDMLKAFPLKALGIIVFKPEREDDVFAVGLF